tara:strand:+ start:3082 stop:3714 length:633 start_codon:yes stop_codon:yes gene_type:complete
VNDLMRTGPLGATAQASKLGYRVVRLSASTHATVATAVALGKAAAASGVMGIVKATGNSYGWLFPTCHAELMGGEWVIESLQAVFTDDPESNDVTFDVGIYAQAADGTITVVDVDAIVDGEVIAHGSAGDGTIVQIPLDGLGGGLRSYDTAAGNAVTCSIGVGVGTFTSGDASVAGQNQFLYLTNGTSIGDGTYIVYAVCKPVGGSAFKN